LKNINQATRPYAHRLLQCLAVAVRPLRLEELAEILAFDFDDAPVGIPKLNVDWRREDQERSVLSTCSSLITIAQDGDSRVVHFSHFSVKEFLTSDRLAVAAEDISFYHIAPAPAHTILARACLGVLLRLDDTTWETFVQRFPLAEYATQHWVDHALFENVSLRIKDGIEILFDVEKPHFSRWIRVLDNVDDDYSWPEAETRLDQLEAASMYCAAHCGFHDVLEKLIREHPEHVGARGGPFGTPLHAASRMNHLEVVQSLLRHGADVNAPGVWGRTPLLFASVQGHLEVARWLLEHGANVNAKDKDDDWTSLHLSAMNGHFEIVRTLLKHNAATNARNDYRRTPLHLASINNRVDVVRLLLSHGADLKARDKIQWTSLHHVASFSGSLEVARLLLEHGAEVDAEDKDGRTAYQIALDKGCDEIAQLLLEHGAESRT
jgi:ankyrin repeat protein